jgi:hypothetical protein
LCFREEDLNQREGWYAVRRCKRLGRFHQAENIKPQAPAPVQKEGALCGPVGRRLVYARQLNQLRQENLELRALQQIGVSDTLVIG